MKHDRETRVVKAGKLLSLEQDQSHSGSQSGGSWCEDWVTDGCRV